MATINDSKFLEMTTEEEMDIDGGVATWVIGALVFASGFAIGKLLYHKEN